MSSLLIKQIRFSLLFGLFHAPKALICCDFTPMSSAAETKDRPLTSERPRRAPGLSPVIILCAFVLTAATVFSLWIYIEGSRAIRVQAKVHGVSLGTGATDGRP